MIPTAAQPGSLIIVAATPVELPRQQRAQRGVGIVFFGNAVEHGATLPWAAALGEQRASRRG